MGLFRREPEARALRAESFGAIAQLVKPRALVFVDRQYARELGIESSALWSDPQSDGEVGREILAAPLEAHLQLTNRCDAGCTGCYTAASPGASREWGLEQWKRAVDELAAMGVFHLALGGGESADLPWLEELVRHARARGLVPNLTTSGLSNLERLLGFCHLFGQINVSLDGLEDEYRRVRGFDGFHRAADALVALRKRTKHVGINVVLTRHNVNSLDEILRFARKKRLNEVELLRFKPAGRGVRAFEEMSCTDPQHRALLPAILRGARRHRIRVRVDCSFMPMLAHHRPERDLLAHLAVYGCTAGDFLIGAKATGQVCGCSFASPDDGAPSVAQLGEHWNQEGAFESFRSWRLADEPCASCDYHDLCRGGCKVVSRHLTGDYRKPDPQCPRVVDYLKKAPKAAPKTLPLVL